MQLDLQRRIGGAKRACAQSPTSSRKGIDPYQGALFGGSRWRYCRLASNNKTVHLITRSAQTKKKGPCLWRVKTLFQS